MTTIAWDGRTLVADRLADSSGYIHKVTKIRRGTNNRLLGASGPMANAVQILRYLTNPEKEPAPHAATWEQVVALEIERNPRTYKVTIWRWECGERWEVDEPFTACGSGRDYAIATMFCGKSAQDAVEVAARFDPFTGCGVDTLEFLSA